MRTIIQYLAIILLCFTAFSFEPLQAAGEFILVIDPGHGGRDPGATKRKGKLHEKDVVLKVARQLGRKIEANYKDVRVVYTRSEDKTVRLPERVRKAKDVKGTLFLSIHVNSSESRSLHGFETYVFGVDNTGSAEARAQSRYLEERENLDIVTGKPINFDTDIDLETKMLCEMQRAKHNKYSDEFANKVQNNLIAQLKTTSYAKNAKGNGVFRKNLYVLCYVPMPAVLVELGYISNAAEENFLTSDEGINCFVTALYTAFRQYKKNWDARQLPQGDRGHQQVDPAPQHGNQSAADQKPAKEQKNNNSASKDDKKNNGNSQATQNGQEEWRVQFLTSDRLLQPGAKEFKGLKNVTYYKEGKIYKYTYGSSPTQQGLRDALREVKKLFPGAFPVKIGKDGKRA